MILPELAFQDSPLSVHRSPSLEKTAPKPEREPVTAYHYPLSPEQVKALKVGGKIIEFPVDRFLIAKGWGARGEGGRLHKNQSTGYMTDKQPMEAARECTVTLSISELLDEGKLVVVIHLNTIKSQAYKKSGEVVRKYWFEEDSPGHMKKMLLEDLIAKFNVEDLMAKPRVNPLQKIRELVQKLRKA